MIHIEVRKKIIEARTQGVKIAELSKAYCVSESAIIRLLRMERETGSIEPKTYLRGRKPELDETGLNTLRALIHSQPDITLEEIKTELGLKIGITAIHYIVHDKLGFRYKKRQYTPANETDLMS